MSFRLERGPAFLTAAVFLMVCAYVAWQSPDVQRVGGRLVPPPPDLSAWLKDINRAHFQRDVERQSVIWDQNHVDTMLLICERAAGGFFTRGKERYYCVRRGTVEFEWEFGKELFWSRMQNRLPERSARSEDKPASPWYPL